MEHRFHLLAADPWTSIRATVAALVLLLAALQPATAADDRYLYAKQFTVSPKGVNVQTGRFIYSATDVSMGELSFVRRWGDQSDYPVTLKPMGARSVYNRLTIGWNHTLNQGTQARSGGSGTRVQVFVDGAQYEFAQLSGGAFVPIGRPSAGTYLRKNGTNFLFTDKAGNLFSFIVHAAIDQGGYPDLKQLLAQTTRADGTVIGYSYRSNGQLQEARSSRGYALHLDYDVNINVSKVCGYNLANTSVDPAAACQAGALAATYSYDGTAAKLSGVTDPSGDVVTMVYSDYGPTCITRANSSTCAITNTYAGPTPPAACISAKPDQVVRQLSATGAVWDYCYNPPEDPNDVPYVPGRPRWSQADMVDPATGLHVFTYDRGRLVDHDSPDGLINYKYPNTVITLPFGTTTATFEFLDTLPELVTLPRGDRQFFIYDPRGNLIIQSRWPLGSSDPVLENGSAALSSDPDLRRCCIAPGNLQIPAGAATIGQAFRATYYYATTIYAIGCGTGDADAKLCDKPILRIDERGNQTVLDYDAAHGGIIRETGPPVNGVSAQTRYTYVQRYAWLKNGGGTWTQAATPVWLLASKSLCKTGAASGSGCAVGGDEVVTTYDYGPNAGPNNLLLRGVVEDANGLALRTCYSYDAQGNRISETKPRAGLGSCP